MRIGIIAAMSKELNLLLPLMEGRTSSTVNGFDFHCGSISGREVVAMQCGIGKVNAAIGCMTMIDRFTPDMIINTGVAGGTGAGARVLDIVVADRIGYHDVWCGFDAPWGKAAACPPLFEADQRFLSLPCLQGNARIKRGLVASGDIFVDTPAEVSRILSVYPDAIAIDMESAALAHTCYRRGVPFFCIRVVSDTPGAVDDNASQYADFWEDAPRQAFALLTDIINEL